MSEETRFSDGRMMHGNLLDYRVPTMAESPDIEVHHRREHRPQRTIRRQRGERGHVGRLPSCVMDAVYEAAAIRPDVLPLTPERIVELLDVRDGVQS